MTEIEASGYNGMKSRNLTGKVHWLIDINFMLYHGLFHVHVTHVRIQDSIPTEITCFKNKTFKTPFLQKCTSKMCFFFFFRESNSAKLHEAHVLSGWMGYSLASHSPNLRYYKGLTDSVEIFGEMGCSEHINTTSTNLPQLYGMLMSIRIFIYIYIHIISFWRERWYSYILYCKLLYPTDVSVTGNTTAEVFVFLAELQKLRLRLPLITAVDTLT